MIRQFAQVICLTLFATQVGSCSALSTTGDVIVMTGKTVGKTIGRGVSTATSVVTGGKRDKETNQADMAKAAKEADKAEAAAISEAAVKVKEVEEVEEAVKPPEDVADEEFKSSRRIPMNVQDLKANRLDALLYQGGLELSNKDKHFGGMSGLLVSDNGKRFLAVSDKGHWVTGDLIYRNGELVGAKNIDTKPMRDLDGKKIEGKYLGDAESLIGDMDGQVLVSFEKQHRIWGYDRSGEKPHKAAAFPVGLPKEVAQLKSNGGLEGITRLQDSANSLLIISEETRDVDGNIVGWIIKPGGYFRISLKAMNPYKLTDLVTLPMVMC